MKDFRELAWPVTEPEYRKHPALSYSTLARFEREGFSCLPTLFDPISSPSLTFGSVVDELITGNEESFNKRFIVAKIPKLEPAVNTAMENLVQKFGKTRKTIADIPENDFISTLDDCDFYKRWSVAKRLEKITGDVNCINYYRLCRSMLDEKNPREVITDDVYSDAKACVDALRNDVATHNYFSPSTDNIKKYYQLKFKAVIDGIEYRCMVDELVVNYKAKVVIPVDLKTSSSPEYSFFHSFLKWRYDIQARLYWKILRTIMDQDEFFKDFELRDFRFVVVNKVTKEPLQWGFSKTQENGDLMLGGKLLRSPLDIGKELKQYLEKPHNVPLGIEKTGINDICVWIQKTTL